MNSLTTVHKVKMVVGLSFNPLPSAPTHTPKNPPSFDQMIYQKIFQLPPPFEIEKIKSGGVCQNNIINPFVPNALFSLSPENIRKPDGAPFLF